MKFHVIIILFCLYNYDSFSQERKPDSILVEEFIEKKRAFNKEFGYGFRIQLYNGLDEIEAKMVRAKFKYEHSDITTYLAYREPEWIVQVGQYKTKLQADRILTQLKKNHPSAIVVPLGK